jgi:hypothetical protein
MKNSGWFSLTLLMFSLLHSREVLSQDSRVQFFGSDRRSILGPGPFDPAIPSPHDYLKFPLGERPVRQAQVLEYFGRLDEATERLQLVKMGETYEGRPLVYAVISDEQNMARLNDIRTNLSRIADPRQLSRSGLASVIEKTPAAVWLAYSIHGDEVSGVDASLAVAYTLAAGMDTLTQRLRKELVVIIDPMENPDGRERYLAQMEAFATAVPSADGQSLQKSGFWPRGRGNHYLFDMNRDWFTQELPESKARMAAIVEWHPQVLVDAHEMDQWDTYLFSPPRHPFNPQLTDRMLQWWNIFAADQAAAFDRRGWAYYTRDWNEEWYPGYGSSWPLFAGAVGILYEQARVSGSRISRHDGTVLTYAESVEHHYVSSIANLTTAANNRRRLLSDYYDHRAKAIAEYGGGKPRAFLVAPDNNPDRLAHLAETLTRQEIQVLVARDNFSARVRSYYEPRVSSKTLPRGTLIIPADQPQGFLVQTILGFDPRIPDSTLVFERRELLKNRSTKLYEITSWSLLLAYGLDAYETEASVSPLSDPWKPRLLQGSIEGRAPQLGFMIDGSSDRGLRAIARLHGRGLNMFAARKDLDIEGRSLPRGSVFLPARSNPAHYEQILDTIARETGVRVVGINRGLGNAGPDLGSRELGVLKNPRVALLAGGPTNSTSVGWVWHLFDQKIGLPIALLETSQVGQVDLSVYNVLIMPDAGGYSHVFGKPTTEKLRKWIENGGTLIAIDAAAAFCADSLNNLSAVRTREQVLHKLTEYEQAATEEMAADEPDISKLTIWDYPEKEAVPLKQEERPIPKIEELQKANDLARLFSPHGSILRVDLDTDDWLTFGMGDKVPVMIYSSNAFLAKYPPVRTVARFAPPKSLRISGLLWPEARSRLANSSYCTRERIGQGQIILFADQPNFRAYFRGSERLLSNAVLYGPGLGTSWAPRW